MDAVYRLSERAFDRLLKGYGAALRWVLRHQFLMLLVTIATACLSVYLYVIVPKGFFPQQDTGRLIGSIQAEQDISFQAMRQKMNDYVAIIMQDPAVDTVTAFAGGGGNCQHWPHVHHVEAAGRTKGERRSGHRTLARQAGARSRRYSVSCSRLRISRSAAVIGNAQYQYTLQSRESGRLECVGSESPGQAAAAAGN